MALPLLKIISLFCGFLSNYGVDPCATVVMYQKRFSQKKIHRIIFTNTIRKSNISGICCYIFLFSPKIALKKSFLFRDRWQKTASHPDNWEDWNQGQDQPGRFFMIMLAHFDNFYVLCCMLQLYDFFMFNGPNPTSY